MQALTFTSTLLQVKAAGVNRLDLLQAKGSYPPPQGASEILGVEGTTYFYVSSRCL